MWEVYLVGNKIMFENKKLTYIHSVESITRLYIHDDDLHITIDNERHDFSNDNSSKCKKLNSDIRELIRKYYSVTRKMI